MSFTPDFRLCFAQTPGHVSFDLFPIRKWLSFGMSALPFQIRHVATLEFRRRFLPHEKVSVFRRQKEFIGGVDRRQIRRLHLLISLCRDFEISIVVSFLARPSVSVVWGRRRDEGWREEKK